MSREVRRVARFNAADGHPGVDIVMHDDVGLPTFTLFANCAVCGATITKRDFDASRAGDVADLDRWATLDGIRGLLHKCGGPYAQ